MPGLYRGVGSNRPLFVLWRTLEPLSPERDVSFQAMRTVYSPGFNLWQPRTVSSSKEL